MLADPISHLPPAEREQKERRERLRALQHLSSPDDASDDEIRSPNHTTVDGKTPESETLPDTPLVSPKGPVQNNLLRAVWVASVFTT